MKWREAFLRQARDDNEIRKLLNRQGAGCSHQLHYLQMATEKFSKGFLCSEADSSNAPKMTHTAFVSCLRVIKGRPEICNMLGYGSNKTAFRNMIDSLLPMADMVEKLAPALAGQERPNPEYPWKDNNGDITAPVDFDFPLFSPKNQKTQSAATSF